MHKNAHESSNPTPEIIALGYDTRDIHIPAVIWNIAAVLATVVLSMILMVWMFGHLQATQDKADAAEAAAGPSFLTQRRIPNTPLLQANEVGDLAKMHKREDEILDSSAWVIEDSNAGEKLSSTTWSGPNTKHDGIARIPIDRAIDLVANKVEKTGKMPYWPPKTGAQQTQANANTPPIPSGASVQPPEASQ